MSQAVSEPVAPRSWPALPLREAHARLTAPGSRFEMSEALVHGVSTRVWKHAPPSLRELFLFARRFGAREFIVYERERASYEGFARAALAVAAELQNQGVQKGDRVALAMRNLPEWPVIFFGAALAGAIVTPLNAWWTGEELAYGLKDCGAKIAFVDAERLERLGPHLDDCPAGRVYVSRHRGALPAQVRRLEAVTGEVADWMALPAGVFPAAVLAPDDDVTILYTSGTTGAPKGAVGSHRNMISNIMATGFCNARNFVRRGEAVPAADPFTTPQRSMLLSIPFFHVSGCFAVLGVALAIGGRIFLMRKFDAGQAASLIAREKISAVGGVPSIAAQILEEAESGGHDLSSLDTISYGGAPSAPELVARIKRHFPNSLASNGWGMTETSAICTSHSGEDYEHRPASAGPAVPVCDLKIMSEDGMRELDCGEIGELWARGPNIVRGYWNRPAETAATFVEGWVRTGDLARLDEEGFLTIVDRAKDMLIRGGENIYCIEVENALCAHPAVLDAGLVGIPHKTLGEEPGALVHLREGRRADEAELRAFVAARLAAFKVPVRILFSPQPLLRGATGKILKLELKKLFA